MNDDLRYAPSDCFATFPFPANFEIDSTLEAAGRSYCHHRAEIMVANVQGLTKTYNRFHDPHERDPGILRLRELHAEMDDAVLRAFGWDDLADAARPEHLTEETEFTYQGRYFWPSDFRNLVLARLLDLNRKRAAEEAHAAGHSAAAERSEAVVSTKAGQLGMVMDHGPLFDREDSDD